MVEETHSEESVCLEEGDGGGDGSAFEEVLTRASTKEGEEKENQERADGETRRRLKIAVKICSELLLVLIVVIVLYTLSILLVYSPSHCPNPSSSLVPSPSPSPLSLSSQNSLRGEGDCLTLRDFRTVGSHNRNSFHLSSSLFFVPSFQYSHTSLYDQLSLYQLRSLELDFHILDNDAVLIYHVQLVDDKTSCYCMRSCLQLVQKWSSENPGHFPLYILLEPKVKIYEDLFFGIYGLQLEDLEKLERIVKDVFREDQILYPRTVLGNESSMKMAISSSPNPYPLLSESQGKVMFFLLDSHDSLFQLPQGKVMDFFRDPDRLLFVASEETHDYVSLVTSAHGRIVKDAREKGYMTRMHGTFRDCTQESLSLFQKCLNAGANIISSDCVECDLIPFPDMCETFPSGQDFQCISGSMLG